MVILTEVTPEWTIFLNLKSYELFINLLYSDSNEPVFGEYF
jgi:hypothetical protein